MLQGNLHIVRFSSIACCAYPSVSGNNADLPSTITLVDSCSLNQPSTGTRPASLEEILRSSSAVVAMTELSATAPLKVLARSMGFRGATLPGFSREMVPALLLDYEAIDRRVRALKAMLDRAIGATIRLTARGERHELYLDLRYRTGHASGGLMRGALRRRQPPVRRSIHRSLRRRASGRTQPVGGDAPGAVQRRDRGVRYQRGTGPSRRGVSPAVPTLADTATASSTTRRPTATSRNSASGCSGNGESGGGEHALGRKAWSSHRFRAERPFRRSHQAPQRSRAPRNVVHVDWVYVPSVQRVIAVECVGFRHGDNGLRRMSARDRRLLRVQLDESHAVSDGFSRDPGTLLG